MKKSDLYREWARVLDMCEGTVVDPVDCWKFLGEGNRKCNPDFSGTPTEYQFAVAILEDKPVFVGDEIYSSGLKRLVVVRDSAHACLLFSTAFCSWNPPKKTFMLEFTDRQLETITFMFTDRVAYITDSEEIRSIAMSALDKTKHSHFCGDKVY